MSTVPCKRLKRGKRFVKSTGLTKENRNEVSAFTKASKVIVYEEILEGLGISFANLKRLFVIRGAIFSDGHYRCSKFDVL